MNNNIHEKYQSTALNWLQTSQTCGFEDTVHEYRVLGKNMHALLSNSLAGPGRNFSQPCTSFFRGLCTWSRVLNRFPRPLFMAPVLWMVRVTFQYYCIISSWMLLFIQHSPWLVTSWPMHIHPHSFSNPHVDWRSIKRTTFLLAFLLNGGMARPKCHVSHIGCLKNLKKVTGNVVLNFADDSLDSLTH